MPAGIYISYRREDSSRFAGLLFERLLSRYGHDLVFMDILVGPGEDFAVEIERVIGESAACVVLIGPRWESIASPDGRRRMDDPTDFVRLEVAAAIRLGVTVLPVLIERTLPPIPTALPEDLRAIGSRHQSGSATNGGSTMSGY